MHLLDLDSEEEIRQAKSIYDKYLHRPRHMVDITYFDSLQNWNCTFRDPDNWGVRQTPAKPRVLHYFPRYKAIHSDAQFDDFCWAKLLLNHHHRSYDELLTVDDIRFDTYTEAFNWCQNSHLDYDDDRDGRGGRRSP
ncbi:hypothetical protein GGR54DRAFT_647926 [Hypoxylon sp. NC1633]|nr:hypothetical protein GGR54DRAFT_647926 [Hypoxylon sp. NC1633]